MRRDSTVGTISFCLGLRQVKHAPILSFELFSPAGSDLLFFLEFAGKGAIKNLIRWLIN